MGAGRGVAHHNKRKQAGTELCQAQSKLIQIGRVVGKKFEVEKNLLSRNYILVKYMFLAEKCLLDRRKFWTKKFLGQKIFWVKKILGQKLFWVKKCWSKRFGSEIFLSKKNR